MRIVDDYNHTKHSSTNEVPFEVFFSLISDLIIEIFTGLSEPGYFNPGYSSNITPFAIPEEELESRRQKAKDYLEISAAKNISRSLKKMNSAGQEFIEGQKVLVRRPPSKKFSKGLNIWVAVGIIRKIFENFFYEVELVGEKKDIKGLNLKRIHHR